MDITSASHMRRLSLMSALLAIAGLAGGTAYAGILYFYGGSEDFTPMVAGAAIAGVMHFAVAYVLITRHERNAIARLKESSVRNRWTGVFAPLVEEACQEVQTHKRTADTAFTQKTELEAKSHVTRRRTQRMHQTIECLSQPVVITDTRDEVQFFNPAAVEFFQSFQACDINGQPTLEAIPQLLNFIRETRECNEAADRRKVEFDLKIGEAERAVRAITRTVYDTDNTLLGVSATLEDIVDERIEKQRHAEFVSKVAHELKTPMASIRAYVEMLQDGDVDDPEEAMELYGFIEVQVEHLTRLVNNMLDLTRIQSGVIEIHREDCELNEVLRHSIDTVEPMAEDKGIRVISELSELYMPAHVDTDQFGRAIINLLSNAVKYTPEGGEVRVRSRMLDETNATIEVRDTGMGIPEDALPHIFERFYRVKQNNKAAAGTGLGLALVQYIVTEIHNGSIKVTSKVDEGTSFEVTIPIGHRIQAPKKRFPVTRRPRMLASNEA